MTSKNESLNEATRRLARVLRAENDALAAADYAAAALLVPEKQSAVTAVQACLPGARPEAGLAATLKEVVAENMERLTLAISVQQSIVAMVTRAARAAAPGAVSYGKQGQVRSAEGAMALVLRA